MSSSTKDKKPSSSSDPKKSTASSSSSSSGSSSRVRDEKPPSRSTVSNPPAGSAAAAPPKAAAPQPQTADDLDVLIVDARGRPLRMHMYAMKGNLDRVMDELANDPECIKAVDSDGCTALHHACFGGFIRVVRHLIKKAPTLVNQAADDGITPLHQAAFKGHREVAEELLRIGAKADAADLQQGTPLHNACFGGHVGVVEALIAKGANVKAADSGGATALHYAAFAGHDAIVKLLIKDKSINLDAVDKDRATPLHHACFKGYVDVVDTLLNSGAKLSSKDVEGGTPLHTAAFNGHPDVVRRLLKSKADPEAKDREGASPLHKAAYQGHVEVVKILAEGAKSEVINQADKQGATALHKASFNGQTEVVKFLLTKGAKVTLADKDGGTALHNAIFNGHISTALALLKNKADANVTDAQGRTPLHGAASYGLRECVLLLLSKGCDPNVVDGEGQTPLHLAAHNGSVLAITMLLDKGAKSQNNKHGLQPLHYASFRGNVGASALLCERKFDVTVKDAKGDTPLHHAALTGETEMAAYLLYRGANIDEVNLNGDSALHYAVSNDWVEAAYMLLEKGAKVLKNKAGKSPRDLAIELQLKEMTLLFEIIASNPEPFTAATMKLLGLRSHGMREAQEEEARKSGGGGGGMNMAGRGARGGGGGGRAERIRNANHDFVRFGCDFDLNDPVDLCEEVVRQCQQTDTWQHLLNVMRHFVLIPQQSALAKDIWTNLEVFTHGAIILRAEGDDSVDMLRPDLKMYLDLLKDKAKFNLSTKLDTCKTIAEALQITFPGIKIDQPDNLYDTATLTAEDMAKHEVEFDDDEEDVEDGDEADGGDGGGTKKGRKGKGKEADSDADLIREAKQYKVELDDDLFGDFSRMGEAPSGGGGGGPPPGPGGKGGPPPPPGMKGGPPPPPGGKKRTGPKMKRLNWAKIPRGKFPGCVFDGADMSKILLDEGSLEKHFSVAENEGKNKEAAAPKVIQLIDSRRAQNIGIMLARLKLPTPKIKKAIEDLDESFLTIENARSLSRLAPTAEEIEQLKAFDGDKSKLGNAEQFLMALMVIPRVQQRMETILFKLEYAVKCQEIVADIKKVMTGIVQLRGCKKFNTILLYILVLGNFLNAGSLAGDALGFKLSGVLKIRDTKSSNNKFNLMHYLTGLFASKHPELMLQVEKDLPDLCENTGERVSQLVADVATQKKGLKELKMELEVVSKAPVPGDPYLKIMGDFDLTATRDIEKLEKGSTDLQDAFNKITTFYGEELGQGIDVVTIAIQFARMWEDAHKENLERAATRARLVKEAKLKAEKQMARRAKIGGGSTSTGTASNTAKASIDDDHLAKRKRIEEARRIAKERKAKAAAEAASHKANIDA